MAEPTKKRGRPRKKGPPATTVKGREDQAISLAYDLAEKQLANGTASSQIVTHFLKIGTVRAQIELEKLKRENELLAAKTEALQSAKRMEGLYAKALDAMRGYSGQSSSEEEVDD